jgi:hypothetical protein
VGVEVTLFYFIFSRHTRVADEVLSHHFLGVVPLGARKCLGIRVINMVWEVCVAKWVCSQNNIQPTHRYASRYVNLTIQADSVQADQHVFRPYRHTSR